MTDDDKPRVPDYVRDDLVRTLNRIAANERWYEQQWLGVPIWQMPDDLQRLQDILVAVRPRWIVETGTKFGGSAIFFSSLLKMLGLTEGGVISLDIHRTAEAERYLADHLHADLVRAALLGDGESPELRDQVVERLDGQGPVLVFLDDDHNADHVEKEMELYAPLVTPGSYLIVADTVYQDLADTPLCDGSPKYAEAASSNPRVAIGRFLVRHPEFERDDRFEGRGLGNFNDGFLKRS